jgi:Lon protease-like protein
MMRRTTETESRTFGMCGTDEQTGYEKSRTEYFKISINYRTFTDYGTLLFIRGLVYTPDGRSVVDTIGQRRFRVLERGMKDGYNTARVELFRDHQIEQHEFDGLLRFKNKLFILFLL